YYMTSDVDDTVGFQGRLEANINDDLQIGGKLTTDDIFDTNVYATMTLRSPRGSWANFFRKDWLRQPSVQTQMDRSPERAYRIATDVKASESATLAINPADGQPFLVLHVDPTNGTGGGTFEDPAGFIANDPRFDIIYVQPGTLARPAPITLFDNQRLLSTAVTHTFDSQRGTFQLPGFTGGPLPILRNTSLTPSAVIVLADNNEVSGFQIDGTGGANSITGQPVFHAGILGDNITSFDINRNSFTNVTSGVQIVHVGTGAGFLSGNTVIGRGDGSSLGMSVAAVGGSNLNLFVRGNTVTGFLGEDANGNSAIDAGEDANNNLVLDPGVGINILGTTTSTVSAVVTGNNVTGNATGLNVAATTDAVVSATVRGNNISNNVDAGATVIANDATMTASFATNTISANGGPGINASANDGADLTLNVGGVTALAGNTIDANAGAGVAISVGTTSIARANIRNNDITNTVDDGDALTRFGGQGIDIFVGADGQYVDSVIDMNTITGNVSDGLLFTAQGIGTLRNITVGNLDGDNNNGNVFSDNLNGIGLIRTGNARVDQLRIIDNEIFNNVQGFNFRVGGGLLDVTDVLLADNNIVSNAANGIFGVTSGNGIINLDLTNNVIAANGVDGIQIQQNRFTIDQGGVTGTWDGNFIADNLIHGIDVQAPMRDLIVGTTDVGNLILRNGEIGVLLIGPGTASFTNNTIAQNGAANGDVTLGAGIDIEGPGFKDFTFVNNRVVDNFGDGVEIAAGSNGASQFFTLNFVDNIVARNDGRGYDVLNQGNSFMDLTIRGTALGRSVIAENGREGIYVVNTASFNQTQQGETPVTAGDDPTHGMDNNAPFTNGSFMTLNVQQNQIVGNGIDQVSVFNPTTPIVGQSVGGTGLVIRVGTGDGGYGPFAFGVGSDGGFASQGFAGVIATVTDNFMSGNFGADVYTESFTSTGDPPTTAGVWSATEFRIDNYEGDPLARLDLTFVNNTLEEADFNNVGAFYDNAEGTFKSRTNGRTPPDPQGEFFDADRRRNAQRLAYRDETLPSSSFPGGQPENDGSFLTPGPDGIFGTPDDVLVPIYDLNPQPNSPPNPFIGSIDDLFLYPGMGESTFRISQSTLLGTNTLLNSDGTTTAVSGASFFLLDNQPYNDDFDANGVFIIPFRIDDMPYGWSVIQ
ncbi:MAG: right-handed parallel beta-helix repeat-containing protein, partial [Planctomycetota bacterium]|nr:right-handed parallel beta-helix repeat-containing protein [Planctomycetota bacterium]